MNHDLLHIQGKPYVLLPLHEYRSMTDGGIYDNSGLPEEILNKISAGTESAVKIIRKYRGLTQAELANEAGLSRPYLTEIETGKKNGSIKALTYIANILDVPAGLLL
jgi:DNA-binding XRE family transcriptional regulator